MENEKEYVLIYGTSKSMDANAEKTSAKATWE
jgi:hypothetical protein